LHKNQGILQQTYCQLPNKASSPSWSSESRLRVSQNVLVWIKHPTSKKTVNGVLHNIVHKLFTKAFLPSKCHILSWYMHNFIYISKNSVAFPVPGFTKLSNGQ